MSQQENTESNGYNPPSLLQHTYQVLPQYVGADATSTLPYLLPPSDALAQAQGLAPTNVNIYYVAGKNAVQATPPYQKS